MLRSHVLAAGTLLFAVCNSHAAAPQQRWVKADDVRVRSGPSAEHRIAGTLPRGAQLVQHGAESNGFCQIEGEGQSGYVACSFLSATSIARPRAGADGIDPAQRWVTGNSVTLRDAPNSDAPVVQRLSVNSIVKLVKEQPGSGYCEVQPGTGPAGFTACRYLSVEPLNVARLMGNLPNGADSPDYSPEKVFWLHPGWAELINYAQFLQKKSPATAGTGPWPRDEALEKMKAHLALGIKGDRQPAYPDWTDLKRKAARDLDLSGTMARLQDKGKPGTTEQQGRATSMRDTGALLQQAISLWGHHADKDGVDLSYEATIGLVRALDLPVVRPSLFRSEADIAPPGTSAEAASGRFGIVFRQLVSRRPTTKSQGEQTYSHGVYDMLTRTQALVRPVQRVQLFRDGKLRAEPSVISGKETLWGELDEPMCHNWSPGFAFGQSEGSIWNYFGHDDDKAGAESAKSNPNPAGSLFAFYLPTAAPAGPALRAETRVKLVRAETGFVGGTHLHYDLDADGVPDLSVWEGLGRAQGHLDGPTKQDDYWYRLAFVNINGAWKVLGSDSFGYGCGC